PPFRPLPPVRVVPHHESTTAPLPVQIPPSQPSQPVAIAPSQQNSTIDVTRSPSVPLPNSDPPSASGVNSATPLGTSVVTPKLAIVPAKRRAPIDPSSTHSEASLRITQTPDKPNPLLIPTPETFFEPDAPPPALRFWNQDFGAQYVPKDNNHKGPMETRFTIIDSPAWHAVAKCGEQWTAENRLETLDVRQLRDNFNALSALMHQLHRPMTRGHDLGVICDELISREGVKNYHLVHDVIKRELHVEHMIIDRPPTKHQWGIFARRYMGSHARRKAFFELLPEHVLPASIRPYFTTICLGLDQAMTRQTTVTAAMPFVQHLETMVITRPSTSYLSIFQSHIDKFLIFLGPRLVLDEEFTVRWEKNLQIAPFKPTFFPIDQPLTASITRQEPSPAQTAVIRRPPGAAVGSVFAQIDRPPIPFIGPEPQRKKYGATKKLPLTSVERDEVKPPPAKKTKKTKVDSPQPHPPLVPPNLLPTQPARTEENVESPPTQPPQIDVDSAEPPRTQSPLSDSLHPPLSSPIPQDAPPT
ncbi:hypothetical protein P7C73_g6349, partial [Tremellales sp. Uapishka_1]